MTSKILGMIGLAEGDTDKVGKMATALQVAENAAVGVLDVDVSDHLYTIGENDPGTVNLNQLVNEIYLNKYTLPAGDIVGMRAYATGVQSGNDDPIIYNDSSGVPGSLLVQGSSYGTMVAGWQRQDFASPQTVTAGVYHCGWYTGSVNSQWKWKQSQPANEFYFRTSGITYSTAPDPFSHTGTNTNRPGFTVVFQGPVEGDLYLGPDYIDTAPFRTLYLHGAQTANITVYLPRRYGCWLVHNDTSGAFTVTVLYAGGYGTGCTVDQGDGAWLWGDGEDIYPVETGGTKVT